MFGSIFFFPVAFYVCEALNVANVIGQFYFTNFFLDHEFHNIAMRGLQLEENESILPILAECRLRL